MTPQIRYARCGKLNIAYQVVGDGPTDLVVVPGWISNIEVFWEDSHVARFFEKLATFTRLILFDKRGTGLSDRDIEPRVWVASARARARVMGSYCGG
jgi:pimeloyl-ACP methyl ester carboxylesterase